MSKPNDLVDPDFIPDDPDFIPDEEFNPKYQYSKLESAGKAAAQVLTMEHADEIESAITGQPLNEVRQEYKEAESQNPLTYNTTKAGGDVLVGAASMAIHPAAPLVQIAMQGAGQNEGGVDAKMTNAAANTMVGAMVPKAIDKGLKGAGEVLEDLGQMPYIQTARQAWNKGLEGIKLKGNEFRTQVVEKARIIPERLQGMLEVFQSETGRGIGQRLAKADAEQGAMDIADLAESYIAKLKSLKPANETEARSVDLALQTIEGSILGRPKPQTVTKIPYAVEKTSLKPRNVFIPGESKQVVSEMDPITGNPMTFKKEKISVPGSSYQAPGYGSTQETDQITGQVISNKSVPGSQINIPGYTSEIETGIPLMKNQVIPGRNVTYMDPVVEEITGFQYVKSPEAKIRSVDPLTGVPVSNAVKTPSQIYEMKKSADRMLGYNKNNDPDFSTKNFPAAHYVLDDWRHQLASIFRKDPELSDLMTRNGAASEALDELPNLRTFLNSDRVFSAPDRDIDFQNFLGKMKQANPEDFEFTMNEIIPIIDNYRLAAITDPTILTSSGPKWGVGTVSRIANKAGNMAGKMPRNAEAVREMFPVVLNQLSRVAPEKATELSQALMSGDDALIDSIAGTFAPFFSEQLEPAPSGSKGQYTSFFGGKLHSPVDRQQYIMDVSQSELSNTEKAKRINEMNKSGKIILDTMNVPGKIR